MVYCRDQQPYQAILIIFGAQYKFFVMMNSPDFLATGFLQMMVSTCGNVYNSNKLFTLPVETEFHIHGSASPVNLIIEYIKPYWPY